MEATDLFPDIITPAPLNNYIIGADFCKKENEGYIMILNKDTKIFEYKTKAFNTDKQSFEKMVVLVAEYFKTEEVYCEK